MYRNITIFVCMLCMLCFTAGCHAASLDIVVNARSEYSIVLPDRPAPGETKAAGVLHDMLMQISGADIPVISESSLEKDAKGIFIGATQKVQSALDGIKGDGFLIRQDDAHILLAGKRGHGTTYAVYNFLERYLGCRKYDRSPVSFQKRKTIRLDNFKDELVSPAFAFRQAYYPESNDAEYLQWHGLHRFEDLWGLWGHSFFKLLSPKDFFSTHPEYFALVNGKRTATQLCLSNPQVLQIVISRLRQMIADNPDAEYWSVGPNDENGYCTCELCKKADTEEGGPSGSLIRFVNQVAAAFPDKKIVKYSRDLYQWRQQLEKEVIGKRNKTGPAIAWIE